MDNGMYLADLLGLDLSKKGVVSFVGAGGKTTLLFALGKELAFRGKRIVLTTTTKMYHPLPSQCIHVVTGRDISQIEACLRDTGIAMAGLPCGEGKLGMPDLSFLSALQEAADYLLIEADGAHALPVKFPREGEPVLPIQGGAVAALCGLSCLGKPLAEVCHRAPLAQKCLGADGRHRIGEADIAALLDCAYGIYRPVYVLNQADDAGLCRSAGHIARLLMEKGAERVVGTSFFSGWFSMLYSTET